jgi:hypothetical protein
VGDYAVFLAALPLFVFLCIPLVIILFTLVRRAQHEPFRKEDVLPVCLLLTANLLTNRLIAAIAPGLNMFSSLLFFWIIIRFVYRRQGMDCFLCMVRIVVLLCLMEALCMLLFYLLASLGFDQTKLMVTTLRDFCQPETLFHFSLLNTLSALFTYLLVVLWQTYFEKNNFSRTRESRRFWLYIRILGRILLLLFAGLGMLAMPFTLFGDQSLIRYLIENKEQYVLLTVCCAVLMIIVLSYLVQDLRYIMQMDTIDRMKKMQTISAEHLQSLRQFRHNIANMLYGMQGYIIAGDREKLAAYYAEMCASCALVNNDNIASLEQVPSPAVRTLLLNHINNARQLDLPLNIYVQNDLVIPRVLSEPDLCQILGVLLDNAIEAANEAAERNVALEMRNIDGGLEVIVRNSYAGQVSPQLLSSGGKSTKEGHSGQGLASCHRILARKRNAHLNFWVTGQHVQAQLLLNR